MAEIPVVKRKRGVPAWVWLVALLGAFLLLVPFMRSCDNSPGVESNLNSNSASGEANANRITDVNAYASTPDKSTLAGKAAEIRNVRVARLLSDRVFTVTSGAGEMFAMLDENLDTGNRESNVRLQPGQTVSLSGSFQNVPNDQIRDERRRNLNAREFAQMKGQQVYLHVTNVRP